MPELQLHWHGKKERSMADASIHIQGARQHNLKNIDVKLPKNKLIVFTGG